jgi:MFS transporter, SP family, sugar:H+ symporter
MAGGPAATGPGLGANAPKNRFAGILMVSFAAFAGILFGYDTGTISGITAMKDWLRLFGQPTNDLTNHPTGYMITSSQQSLVTSILSAGTFFGELSMHPTRRCGASLMTRALIWHPHRCARGCLRR